MIHAFSTVCTFMPHDARCASTPREAGSTSQPPLQATSCIQLDALPCSAHVALMLARRRCVQFALWLSHILFAITAVGWPSAPRLRQYKVLTPAGAYVPAAMPGMADLTLKMKKIDPDQGVDGLEMPETVSRGFIPACLTL